MVNIIDLYKNVLTKMNVFGIYLGKMVPTIYDLQKNHIKNLTYQKCMQSLVSVLHKREVLHIVLTALDLDDASEKGLLDPTLQYILKNDEGLYGVDEDLAISLAQLYGSIAVTNYGYLDVHKHGLAKKLDGQKFRVFMDDIVSALIAAAASKLAHKNGDLNKYDQKVVQD